MKKMFALLFVFSVCLAAFAHPPVSEKVLKLFSDAFPEVQGAKWYDAEDGYAVYFVKDAVRCRMLYGKDGTLVSTMRYYGEKDVCPFLKTKLLQKYPNKKVFGVTEVHTGEGLAYHFVLEDATTWLNVLSDATGEMTVETKFKKQLE